MRIDELYLRAFGPFTDRVLDFGASDSRLHVVLGPNEAGKSSLLRALKAWLFGIESNTTDNFIHTNQRLLVGGRLHLSDGAEIACLRRKGQAGNTLRGLDGKQRLVDDYICQHLPGLDRHVFQTVFCIDHDELRKGGEMILQGDGDVGTTLFAAGIGDPLCAALLKELDDEATRLYRPNAPVSPKIARQCSEYETAVREMRGLQLRPEEWDQHDRQLREAEQALEENTKKQSSLQAELGNLRRLSRALPNVRQRELTLEALERLGNVIDLPTDFRERRQLAEQSLQANRELVRKLTTEIAAISDELGLLDVPQPLLDAAVEILRLHQRLDSYLRARDGIVGLAERRSLLLSEAEAILTELGCGHTLESAEALRLGVSQRARIRELGAAYLLLENDREHTRSTVADRTAELHDLNASLGALGANRDVSALRLAVEKATAAGELDEMVAEVQRQLEACLADVGVRIEQIGLWSGPIEALESLPVPSMESLDRFASDFASLQGRLQDMERRLAEIRTKLEALQSTEDAAIVDLPTEEDLGRERADRDARWQIIRRLWLGEDADEGEGVPSGEPGEGHIELSAAESADAFEVSAARSDAVADRLRKEADRRVLVQHTLAQCDSLIRTEGELRRDLGQLSNSKSELQGEWNTLWKPAGIVPLPPNEMVPWLRKQHELASLAEKLRTGRQHDDVLRQKCASLEEGLSAGLAEVARPAFHSDSFAVLLAHCRRELSSIEAENVQIGTLTGQIADATRKLQEAERRHLSAIGMLAEWRSLWESAVLPIGLTAETLPGEAQALLDKLAALFDKVDGAANAAAQVRAFEIQVEEFADKAVELATLAAAELAVHEPDEIVSRLRARLTSAEQARTRRADLAGQVEQKTGDLDQIKQAVQAETELIAELCLLAGGAELAQLPQLEALSDEARALRNKLIQLESQLRPDAGDETIAGLVDILRSFDESTLSERISGTENRIEELKAEATLFNRTIGRERDYLDRIDGTARAAEMAQDAQNLLASIRSDVERYLRVRLASDVLRAAIKDHRQRNQEKLISRASEIFRRLTLGSFERIEVQPGVSTETIIGIRGTDDVAVSGMSSGTRDQLYLSLRVASLEGRLDEGDPVPFVVDDILINFDEKRSAAGLEVLGELASRTQVVFLTHHRELYELASRLGDDFRVRTHQMSA